MAKENSKAPHAVLLSHQEKVAWFRKNIEERQRVIGFQDEQELINFLRELRKTFRTIYKRDVPGYFIRKMAEECGLEREIAPKTKIKMNFAFQLMDDNEHYRNNKSDLTKAIEDHFKEKTLNYILDDIWEEWHDRNDHPLPKINVDLHGQEPLFE